MDHSLFTRIEQLQYYLDAFKIAANKENLLPEDYYKQGVLISKIAQLSVEILQIGMIQTREKFNPTPIPKT
jgi:hypothetical protein